MVCVAVWLGFIRFWFTSIVCCCKLWLQVGVYVIKRYFLLNWLAHYRKLNKHGLKRDKAEGNKISALKVHHSTLTIATRNISITVVLSCCA